MALTATAEPIERIDIAAEAKTTPKVRNDWKARYNESQEVVKAQARAYGELEEHYETLRVFTERLLTHQKWVYERVTETYNAHEEHKHLPKRKQRKNALIYAKARTSWILVSAERFWKSIEDEILGPEYDEIDD